jgi:hypothetical protein
MALASKGRREKMEKMGKMERTGSLVAWGHKDHRETRARVSLFPMGRMEHICK